LLLNLSKNSMITHVNIYTIKIAVVILSLAKEPAFNLPDIWILIDALNDECERILFYESYANGKPI
jgi:hypothetical protein